MDERLPDKLAKRLSAPLPGSAIAARFSPLGVATRSYDAPPEGARKAAVLVLLYPHDGEWRLPLTVRGEHLECHAGQISLPGGALEPGETSDEAAVREFHEELGAEQVEVRLLGRLTPLFLDVSNFHVVPWVGTAEVAGRMTANPAEVDCLLEVPLHHLLDERNLGRHVRQRAGCQAVVPHFSWENHQIWGATCMILGELVTVVRELG